QREHEAAFYRNSLIHAFLETAIVDLGLMHARRATTRRMKAFWEQVIRMRDLLKFDFYFADSAAFRDHVAQELAWRGAGDGHVAAEGTDIDLLLAGDRPMIAPILLRCFFEAYRIVADVLTDAPETLSDKELTKRAMGVGRQYLEQGRIRSNDSVSALLFSTARKVAADQQLLEPAPDLAELRQAFLAETEAIVADINHLEHSFRGRLLATSDLTDRGNPL
ncbi:MAG: hypothetical protein K2W85_14540, partial [Phycisphaerales bacterium]|nr:hypothetical protein [Phycisphaerales bacterium]